MALALINSSTRYNLAPLEKPVYSARDGRNPVRFFNEFDYDIEYVRGKEDVVPDVLSRYPPDMDGSAEHVSEPLIAVLDELEVDAVLFLSPGLADLRSDFDRLKELQLADVSLGNLYQAKLSNVEPADSSLWRLSSLVHLHQDILLFYHPVEGQARVMLPEALVD